MGADLAWHCWAPSEPALEWRDLMSGPGSAPPLVTTPPTHCPAPASISNGYYVTDRQSETPLALPVLEHGEQYETGTIARYLIMTVVKQLSTLP